MVNPGSEPPGWLIGKNMLSSQIFRSKTSTSSSWDKLIHLRPLNMKTLIQKDASHQPAALMAFQNGGWNMYEQMPPKATKV